MRTADRLARPQASRLDASQLIGLAYAAATEPDRWPSCFAGVAASVGHRATTIVVRGFGPARYIDLDAPDGAFSTLNPAVAFRKKTLSRKHFAMAFVGGELIDEWSQLPPEGAGPIGIELFVDEARALEPADRALLKTVLPHLERALTVYFRLDAVERERDGLAACLDALSPALMLLDENVSVLRANRAALELLGGCYGLVNEAGTLRATDPEVDRRLRTMVRTATSGRHRGVRGQSLSAGARIWALGLGPRRAISFIGTDLQSRRLAPELLEHAFELTPAEARVGSLLASGDSVEEVAERLGLSVHTVRAHLKKVLSKTRTHRQPSMVRRLLQTAPPLRA